MAISFKGAHFPQEIILTGVRWYVAYPLSYRHVEELMAERGVAVDHATIQRWVVKYSPLLEAAFHRRKRPVWVSWRMDETYIRVKGEWKYLYRVVDKYGQTIDFLLTEHRDKDAALRFLKKAIRRNGVPETITIDGSDANEAAIKSYNQEYGTAIAIRQVKYFNNIVDEVFLTIHGERHYLWRAVDEDGNVLDILVPSRRNKQAAKKFFRKLLKGLTYVPRVIITDKLKSYGAAKWESLHGVEHRQHRYLNNRAENSPQPTRQRERRMQGCKSPGHAPRFLAAYGPMAQHFRPRRHRFSASAYRQKMQKRFPM